MTFDEFVKSKISPSLQKIALKWEGGKTTEEKARNKSALVKVLIKLEEKMRRIKKNE